MKFIPEMQNKRNRDNQKQTKKGPNVTTCDCVTCCCHPCDNMEIGRIDHSINIAVEQRSALKPNCTAKTWRVRGGRTGPGPCHDIILSLLWRTEPFKPQVQTKCKPVKHKSSIFDRLWLGEEFFLLIRASIFLKMGEIASASLGPNVRACAPLAGQFCDRGQCRAVKRLQQD